MPNAKNVIPKMSFILYFSIVLFITVVFIKFMLAENIGIANTSQRLIQVCMQ